MYPKIIMHNSISLNGAVNGFEADMATHYGVLNQLKGDAVMVGSQTILDAAADIPPVPKKITGKPKKASDKTLPWWVVVDGKGKLKKQLHYFRNMEFIRDIIVLTTEDVSQDYLDFLLERDFEVISAGNKKVDIESCLTLLHSHYKIKTLVTDSGPALNDLLLEKKLISEVSLVMMPELVTAKHKCIFQNLKKKVNLKLISAGSIDHTMVHLSYKVINK
ncbi:MAG: dihydrofolate reductase family protein [Bacteroidota bacterium]